MDRCKYKVRLRKTVVTGFAGGVPDGCWAARLTGRIRVTIEKIDDFMSSPGESRRIAGHSGSRAHTAQQRRTKRHENLATGCAGRAGGPPNPSIGGAVRVGPISSRQDPCSAPGNKPLALSSSDPDS